MSSKKIKLFLAVAAILISCGAMGQNASNVFPVNQGSANVNAQVPISQFKLGLGIPLVPDTAHALLNIPDSLGWLIQIRTTGQVYRRDTVQTGGHYWNPINGGGGGSTGFSLHMVSSANFTTATACPIAALANDSIQIFWNDLGRFLTEGTEWVDYPGGGFSIVLPGFNASANSYHLTVYSTTTATSGPIFINSASFTGTSVSLPQYNGLNLTIYWNDAQRWLIKGTDWTAYAGGGFTITIPGFNPSANSYTLYLFAQ